MQRQVLSIFEDTIMERYRASVILEVDLEPEGGDRVRTDAVTAALADALRAHQLTDAEVSFGGWVDPNDGVARLCRPPLPGFTLLTVNSTDGPIYFQYPSHHPKPNLGGIASREHWESRAKYLGQILHWEDVRVIKVWYNDGSPARWHWCDLGDVLISFGAG